MEDLQKEPTASEKSEVMRVVLPFKVQRSDEDAKHQNYHQRLACSYPLYLPVAN